MHMGKAIISIGIPGSGKSAVLKDFSDKHGYEYISIDDIRREMSAASGNHVDAVDVWQEARKRAKTLIGAGKTVVFEGTFTEKGFRERFITFLRKSGAEKVQGIFFDTPIEVAKERNRERERTTPEEIIDSRSKHLSEHRPELTDGLDSLFTLDEYQQLREAEIKEGGEVKKTFRRR